MKKKFLWIAALFAALALLVTGCPTGGGEDPDNKKPVVPVDPGDGEEFTFWLASGEDGTKSGKDTVTLKGKGKEEYVYVFFTPPGVRFEKLKINYTYGASGTGFDMRWQCAYDASGTWGSVSGQPNYIGWQEKGPSECDPVTLFTQKWGSGHIGNAVDLTTIKGICFAVTVGIGQEANFKLLNVELVGLDYKALLNKSITDAEALVQSEYTSASWTALQTALTAAKAVAGKTNATTDEILSAKTDLDAAIKALVPAGSVDKTALNALITTAKTKKEADYTPESWSVFTEALNAAEEASASASMGQTAIDTVKAALQAAMNVLVPRMYVTNFLYTGTSATTSKVEIDTTGSSPGVSLSSGSIKVPYDSAKNEARLYLKIDPAVDITSYGEITFEWSGHADNSFNISLDMPERRLMMKNASGTSTTLNFASDNPDWAAGWGDAAIGSLSGIEVFTEKTTAITELTISKITIAGTPYVPTYPPADDGLTADASVTLASILTGATGTITNSNASEVYSANAFVKVDGTTPALRLKPAPGDGKGDFRVEITFSPAIDASANGKFSFEWLASGGNLGATTNSYNVNFYFADGGKIGKYSWMSGRSFAYSISASDIEGGTSTSLSKIEIWAEKNDRITNLYIPTIKFEASGAPVVPAESVVVFDGNAGGFVTGASVAASTYVTATASNITITWNPSDNDAKGAFRGQVNLTGTAQTDLSAYSKFKMDWEIPGSSGWVGGSYNITLNFSGNRMLSAYAGGNDGVGTASFDFITDNPSWASGWGDAAVGIITGIEIYSTDNSTSSIVIKKIWFE